MHIDVRGSGPALVMLHGWAMHGGLFAPLAEQLEQRFTLHMVDLPGHGRSADSALPLELAAVGAELSRRIPSALWLGWSLGGLFALDAALRFPAAVRGLVMLCASPRFVRSADWPQGMPAELFRGFAGELGHDYHGTLERFLSLEAQGSDHAREELRRLRAQVFAHGRPAPARLLEGLQLLQDTDLRDGLSRLNIPSLWIAGRRDRLVSPAAMQWSAARTRGGRYIQVEHGGHAPFLSHADEVAVAVDSMAQALAA